MSKTAYRTAVRDSIRDAMLADPRVLLMGEDVGHYGGCYAASRACSTVRRGPDPRHPLSDWASSASASAPRSADCGRSSSDDGQLQPAGTRPDREHRCGTSAYVRRPVLHPLVVRMATGARRQLTQPHSRTTWRAGTPTSRASRWWPRPPWPDLPRDAARRAGHGPRTGDHLRTFNAVQHLGGPRRLQRHRHFACRRAPRLGSHADHLRQCPQGAGRGQRNCRWPESTARSSICGCRGRSRRDDLRLRTQDASGRHRRRAWRTGSLASEISARITGACSTNWTRRSPGSAARCPSTRAKHLEEAALPQVDKIVAAALACSVSADGQFTMPALGADMEEGTLNEWLVQPGDTVTRGRSRRGGPKPPGRRRGGVLAGRDGRRTAGAVGETVPGQHPIGHVAGAGRAGARQTGRPSQPEPTAARHRAETRARNRKPRPSPNRPNRWSHIRPDQGIAGGSLRSRRRGIPPRWGGHPMP